MPAYVEALSRGWPCRLRAHREGAPLPNPHAAPWGSLRGKGNPGYTRCPRPYRGVLLLVLGSADNASAFKSCLPVRGRQQSSELSAASRRA
uniref:Uncharacterized protein n=1 Tax=Rangifer tarandus platyrhynchus TaxID=3082113 RepID=A0ACB0E8X1_RANTA|nr:unnamed protein product [Rangifer tarandus platyrhynchus]